MPYSSFSHSELVSLAPLDLRNARVNRYHGDDIAISVSAFADSDQVILHELYTFLQQLFGALTGHDPEREGAFQRFIDGQNLSEFFDRVRQFGVISYRLNPSPLLAKTIHDVRGGGLTPLLGKLELWQMGHRDSCDALYFLTRDHLKIMRNALLGLDDVKRNADLEIKIHGTDFIVEKWNGAELPSQKGVVRLEVDCPQPVDISECCVEFGALDRILYNLINNACRHTTGESIRLVLFPVPDAPAENLRFVLLNTMTGGDHEHLRHTDLRTLFQAGVSTTGSGYGLNVAAEFVAHAFGLSSTEQAVEGRYLGAELLNDQFAIWFHWPIVPEKQV
jgi:hypothetical protein